MGRKPVCRCSQCALSPCDKNKRIKVVLSNGNGEAVDVDLADQLLNDLFLSTRTRDFDFTHEERALLYKLEKQGLVKSIHPVKNHTDFFWRLAIKGLEQFYFSTHKEGKDIILGQQQTSSLVS